MHNFEQFFIESFIPNNYSYLPYFQSDDGDYFTSFRIKEDEETYYEVSLNKVNENLYEISFGTKLKDKELSGDLLMNCKNPVKVFNLVLLSLYNMIKAIMPKQMRLTGTPDRFSLYSKLVQKMKTFVNQYTIEVNDNTWIFNRV